MGRGYPIGFGKPRRAGCSGRKLLGIPEPPLLGWATIPPQACDMPSASREDISGDPDTDPMPPQPRPVFGGPSLHGGDRACELSGIRGWLARRLGWARSRRPWRRHASLGRWTCRLGRRASWLEWRTPRRWFLDRWPSRLRGGMESWLQALPGSMDWGARLASGLGLAWWLGLARRLCGRRHRGPLPAATVRDRAAASRRLPASGALSPADRARLCRRGPSAYCRRACSSGSGRTSAGDRRPCSSRGNSASGAAAIACRSRCNPAADRCIAGARNRAGGRDPAGDLRTSVAGDSAGFRLRGRAAVRCVPCRAIRGLPRRSSDRARRLPHRWVRQVQDSAHHNLGCRGRDSRRVGWQPHR